MSEQLSYNIEDLSEINISTEEGFIDLKFSITNYSQAKDSTHIICGHALYNNKVVGLGISVRPAMFCGINSNGEVDSSLFYNEGINFYNIGEESNGFVTVLHDLFDIESESVVMSKKVESLTFLLKNNSNSIKVIEIKSKVFFDIDNLNDSYSEWYVNIDLPNKIFELREKDSDYRKGIVNILTMK